jgi:hypothetical protein
MFLKDCNMDDSCISQKKDHRKCVLGEKLLGINAT